MIITIITFIVILSILVFVHELGHFFTALKVGVKPKEFGFGFPPRIFGLTKINGRWKRIKGKEDIEKYKDTVYSINWIPLGGFVNVGEDDTDKKQDPSSFTNQPVWKRFCILIAGVTMNFILAFILLSITFGLGVPSVVDQNTKDGQISQRAIQVLQIADNSPAQLSGIQVGDVIVGTPSTDFQSINDLKTHINTTKEAELELNIQRNQENINLKIKPTQQDDGQFAIGVGLIETGRIKYPFFKAIWQGAKFTVNITVEIVRIIYNILRDLFSGTKVTTEVAGPVGIAVMTGQVVHLGWVYVLQFAALLSINLAILNILPFPALDGGRILFLIIEKIKGRPVKHEMEAIIHQIGFFILIALIILVTYKDIAKYWEKIISVF